MVALLCLEEFAYPHGHHMMDAASDTTQAWAEAFDRGGARGMMDAGSVAPQQVGGGTADMDLKVRQLIERSSRPPPQPQQHAVLRQSPTAAVSRQGGGPLPFSGVDAPPSTTTEDERRSQWLHALVRNRFFIATLTGIIVVFLLMMINPPFVQKRAKSKLYRAGPDVGKLLLYGGIGSLLVLTLPPLLDARRPRRVLV